MDAADHEREAVPASRRAGAISRPRLRFPVLSAHQWRVLGLLGTAGLFDVYAASLPSLALRQIQEGLGIAEAAIGTVAAVALLGAIPAVPLAVAADRAGRRRVLLLTILGFTLCTALTGLARDVFDFVTLQLLARMFLAAEGLLAVVVIAEEFDARTRGWGIGLLGVMGGAGHLVAALAFAGVDALPFGWRSLFALGALPLLLLPWLRRNLHETRRFVDHRRSRQHRDGVRAALEPVVNLVRMYPGRLLALCGALVPTAVAMAAAVTFHATFLQERHGYTPADVAALYVGAAALGVLGNVAAGALGDRFGRKRVLIAGLLANAVGSAVFYNAAGLWTPLAFGLLVFSLPVIQVLYATLGSELFPTSHRSTASGVRAVVFTLGAALGLWCEGRLYVALGSHAAAITTLLAVLPIAPLVIGIFLPETAARELEDVSPEKLID